MQQFCDSNFWDFNLTWNTDKIPDFTDCFEDTILVWIPCIFLWLFSFIDIAKVCKHRNETPSQWTINIILKILLSLTLLAISLTELIYFLQKYADNEHHSYGVDLYTPIIKCFTFMHVIIMILLLRWRGIQYSDIIFIFWLLLTFGAAINYRSFLRTSFNTVSRDNILYDTKLIYFPILFIQFLLYCIHNVIFKASKNSYYKKTSPEESATFLSRITFWWFTSMIIKGYKKALTEHDMWRLKREYLSSYIVDNVDKVISKKKTFFNKNTSQIKSTTLSSGIFFATFKTFWSSILFVVFVKLMASTLTFANPILLDRLINFMSPTSEEPVWKGYFYASLMFITSMLESLFSSQYEFGINQISMNARSCLVSNIYKKTLKLSNSGRKNFTTGEIVNLMSVDIQRIMDFILIANVLWSSPLQTCIALYLLWQQLGVATISGLVVIVLLLPINAYASAKLRLSQIAVMKVKDKRIKLMNEILNCIKVLKFYAWEMLFKDRVVELREEEVHGLKRIALLNSVMSFTISSATYYVGLALFATYVLIDSNNILTANKAFVSLALFNIIRFPIAYLPQALSMTAMCVVSIRRLNNYLNADEIDEKAISHDDSVKMPVVIKSGTFTWTKGSAPSLTNISAQFQKNNLIAIIGKVGSGKSSLLSAMLGDMEKVSGDVNIVGSIAYVPQQPWIQNTTLRKNITFTSDYNEIRYNEVINACALDIDLKILAAGDMTEIGEKGINLSGGQKQRISLARAVYADCDIYLLDDPLSAVDAHVGKHLFDHVIGPNGILQNKTRILVTHRISVLPFVDEIVVIKDGSIHDRGSFKQLITNNADFSDFIAEYLQAEENLPIDKPIEVNAIETIATHANHGLAKTRISNCESNSSNGNCRQGSSNVETVEITSLALKVDKQEKSRSGKLIGDESAETGSVKMSVYKKYMQSFGYFSAATVFVLFVLSNSSQAGSNLWLSEWSNDAIDANKTSVSKRNERLGVYAALVFLESLFNSMATISLNLCCVRAIKLIHNNMLSRIIRAPLAFFDTTPIGRILNRFSKDIDTAETLFVYNLRQILLQLFRVVVSFAMISLQSTIILAALIPITILYYLIQRLYVSTSRQLKRIDSTTRSPIYNHFSETIIGATSIRAYGVSQQFIGESNRRVDDNHECYYPSFTASRWLAIRLEFFGYIIVFLAAVFAVLNRGVISPGITGLSISYSLNVTALLGFLVKALTEVESNIVSVERCYEYTKTPTEADLSGKAGKPIDSWPDKGVIKFEKYSARYRSDLELVLKEISLEIKSGEKVGIVGRTGAGKSSLTMALFRLVESANGKIIIDGLDISELGLHALRAKLTIIPQDTALFAGTLRTNLDPFSNYSDPQIWTVLELAHLSDFVKGQSSGLAYEICEGGDNLSAGQKQLICLARALLRKTQILILDEATAAIDMETDDLIQTTIREEFKTCTIVTIAHRLNTILDYDRVITMDKGMIAEFGAPNQLLADTSSVFYSMAKKANLV